MYRSSNLKSIKFLNKDLEEVKLEKDGLDGKLAGLLKASKNLDHLIESQRKRVKMGTFGFQNGAPMRPPHRPADHRPHDPPMRPMRSNMNDTESPKAGERVEKEVPTAKRKFALPEEVPTGNAK
uniref:Uncharacterized protein n=1 Tax=Tanacetum cinerariifolium TaxID=118510 RepID=A0A6L2M3D4_TANCI|nr:hypothetical protein [Tanacetum cinerariifolium]